MNAAGKKRKRWMIVFGPEGAETGFVEHPRHAGAPGWSYDREEVERLIPPGGRVVDADEFVAQFNARRRGAEVSR